VSAKPSPRKKRLSSCSVIILIILTAIGFHFLFTLPFVRQAIIDTVARPHAMPLPTLTAKNAIEPETVSNVRLLQHWGNGTFHSIAWSPDGRYFAIGTAIGVDLYDGQTFKLIRQIILPAAEPTQPFVSLIFSTDGRFLAAASLVRNLVLIELANSKILYQSDYFFDIHAMAFDKNGSLVCVVNGIGVTTVYDKGYDIYKLDDNKEWLPIRTGIPSPLPPQSNIFFSPEKQSFVFIYNDSIHLIDLISGDEKVLSYNGPWNNVTLLAKDLLLVYHADSDTGVNLLFAYNKETFLKAIRIDGRFDHPLASPDGSLLAAVGPGSNNKGREIRLWKIPELKLIRTIQVPDQDSYNPYVLVFSPMGDRLAYLVSSSIVRIFSTTENASISEIRDLYASISDIAVTSDGKIVALRCSETERKLLELPSANPIATWPKNETTCGTLLHDARTIAVGSSAWYTSFYRKEEFVLPLLLSSNAFSSTGNVGVSSGEVAYSGEPYTVSISQQQFPFVQFSGFYHEETHFKLAVSPSGQYVAATNPSNTYLWVHGFKSEQQYPGFNSHIAFSTDEKYVGSFDGILELETGHITEIEDDNLYINCCMVPVFSSDGKIMAGEDMYGVLHFWQVSNGALLAELDNSNIAVRKLFFSPDGIFLVGLGSGYIEVWGIPKTVH
jgi:WD40 repeat protein